VTQSATQVQGGGSDGEQVGSGPVANDRAERADHADRERAGDGSKLPVRAARAQSQPTELNDSSERATSRPGAQHIEQTALHAIRAATATRGTRTRGLGADGWRLASSFRADAAYWSVPDRPTAESAARPSRQSHPGAPRRRVPPPDSQKMPNASLGGATPTGGSPGAFAMLLLAFALTAPWWVRRRLPSALRRLMAVVSRLDRPG
jgi:hypothetical protein